MTETIISKASKYMVTCRCGVTISPLFVFNVPELKGHCPVCGEHLIGNSAFFKKAIDLLKDIIINPTGIDLRHGNSEANKLMLNCACYAYANLRVIELLTKEYR